MRLDGERAIAAGEAQNPQLDSNVKLPHDTQIDYFTGPRIAEKHKQTLRKEEAAEPIPSLDEILADAEKKRSKTPPPLPAEALGIDVNKDLRMEPPPFPKEPPPLPAEAVGIDVNKDVRMEPPPIPTPEQIIGRDIKEVLKKTKSSQNEPVSGKSPLSISPDLIQQGELQRQKFIKENKLIDYQETPSELGFRFDVKIDNDGSVPLGFLGRNRRRFNELMNKEDEFAARYGMAKNKTNPMDVRRKESWVSRLGKKLGFLGGVAGATAGIGGQIQERFHEDVSQRGTEMAQKLDAEDLAKLRTGQELPIEVKPIDPGFIGFTEKEGAQVEGKNAFTFAVGSELPSDFARVARKLTGEKNAVHLDGGIAISKISDNNGTDSYFFKDEATGEVFRGVSVKDGHITGEARWDNDNLTKKAGTTTGLTTGKIAVTRGLDKNFALTSTQTGETITSAFAGATYEPGSAIDFGNKSRVKAESTGQGASPIQLEPQTWQTIETGEMGPAAKVPTPAPAESVTNKFVLENDLDQTAQAKIDAGIKGNTSATENLRDRPVETQAQKADREAHAAKYNALLDLENRLRVGDYSQGGREEFERMQKELNEEYKK